MIKPSIGGNMFWGLLFLTLGVVLVVQTVFKVNLPIFRVLASVSLIYLGFKLMFGSFGVTWDGQFRSVVTANSVRFGEAEFSPFDSSGALKENAFSTAFGESTVDLRKGSDSSLGATSGFDPATEPISIQTAFGETTVLTPEGIPLEVEYSLAFGSLKIRGEEVNAFGSGTYRTPGAGDGRSALKIKANAAFSEIEIQ